jgi:hypothetical protein
MQEINDDDRNALIWSYQLLDIIPKEEKPFISINLSLVILTF